MTLLYETDREEALRELLSPIVWDWSTNITHRKELVSSRRLTVATVFPFLYDEEKIRAKKWEREESHSELWE